MAHEIVTDCRIDAPPARIWGVISDLERYEDWNPMIVKARGHASPGSPIRMSISLQSGGRPTKARARIRVCEPNQEISWAGGLKGLVWLEHYIRIEPLEEGCRVVHGERFGGLFGGLFPWLTGLSAQHYERMNEALKQRVEGESG